MPASWTILFCAGLTGLLLGSFLNVCIQRLPGGQSVVQPRSHCMTCGETIAWYDNIPVLSFLVLRGRCRHCSTPFSAVYLVVEVVTAVWFVFAAHAVTAQFASGTDPATIMLACVQAAAIAIFGFLLIGLLFMDWQTGLLPNEFTLGGLFVGLFFAGAESFWVPSVRYKTFFTPEEVFFGKRLGAAIVGYCALTIIAWLHRRLRGRAGMGAGDAKQLAMMGAFLGLEQLAVAFFVALLTCTVFAAGLLATRKANGRTALPFGSFLSIGGLFSAVFGASVVHWYMGLFH